MEGLTVSLFDLTGKNAFVTGASRGIGRSIAVALAGAGADVALVARSESGLADTAADITALGRKAVVLPADVTSQDAVAAAVAAAIDQLGHVDVVVNNAGGSNFMAAFLDLRLSGWEKLMRLNLDSAVYVCHAIGGHLMERGEGSVINVASVAGSIKGIANRCTYGASKAAVIGLTKSVAADFVSKGIRCNAVCPGTVDSPSLQQRLRDTGDYEAARKAFTARQPLGRIGTAEEIASIVLWLASDDSQYATGQNFIVDGGITI